jgi:fructose-specific phosphotransferase system IIB component
MKFVGVTACITGIAHTYMAQAALEQAAKKLGHEITVETQGSAGINPMKQEVIDAADGVIFAVDMSVKGRERFAGKPFIELGVAKVIGGDKGVNVLTEFIAAIEAGTAAKVAGEAPAAPVPSQKAEKPAGEKKKGFFGGLFG